MQRCLELMILKLAREFPLAKWVKSFIQASSTSPSLNVLPLLWATANLCTICCWAAKKFLDGWRQEEF